MNSCKNDGLQVCMNTVSKFNSEGCFGQLFETYTPAGKEWMKEKTL
jgi:hypothetical protein